MTIHRTAMRWRPAAIATAVLALTALTGVIFLRTFAPRPPPGRVDAFEGYNRGLMDALVTPEAVGREQSAIVADGSRLPGQPGHRLTEARLHRELTALGAEVFTYPVHLAVPHTERSQIRGADGQSLPNVAIHPFLPNHFQPMVTPAGGLTGTLIHVTESLLLERTRFDDAIAVVDESDPPRSFGLTWSRYAQVGFRALIVTHSNSWSSLRANIRASTPVNYVRLAASPEILNHLGETVTLDVRTAWSNVATTVFVARLTAGTPAREAVAVACCSDACGVLPDRAYGALGAAGIAEALQTFRGLAASRATLRRDVFFVAYASQFMAQLGADRLTALLGPALEHGVVGRIQLERERDANTASRQAVHAALAAVLQPQMLQDGAATHAAIDRLDGAARATFDEQLSYVLNTKVMELSGVALETRLAFLRANEQTDSPTFPAYRQAKERYDEAMNVAGYPAVKLAATRAAFVQRHAIPQRLVERLRELAAWHDARQAELEAGLAINRTLSAYDRVLVMSPLLLPADPKLTPSGERVTFCMGRSIEDLRELQGPPLYEVLALVRQRMDAAEPVKLDGYSGRNQNNRASGLISSLPLDSSHWNQHGYPAFTLVNSDRQDAYGRLGAPVVLPWMTNLTPIASSLRFMGRTALALAHGDGRFEPPAKAVSVGSIGGRVYVANIGKSIVPNHPLAGALFGHKGQSGAFEQPGYYQHPFLFTDVYGRYQLALTTAEVRPVNNTGAYAPEAVAFGADGLIAYIKDEGPQGQAVYRSINLGWDKSRANVNIVAFRATPVAVLDMINPQNLKAFTGFGFVTREGLAPIAKQNVFQGVNDTVCAFLEPDRRFYITLKAGSPDNDLIQTTRAFTLGIPPGAAPAATSREIDGPGYLAADTPFLYEMPGQVARAMLAVNGRRLDLQRRHGMADERVASFHDQGEELLKQAQTRTTFHAARNDERVAATYAILNHPVLRRSIWEAVVGILWYLGLLVPFVFFFEKLVFGFADIRRQLAAQAAIFLVVFILLRLLHPAFAMIRSSLMILLGFVIMLISGGITVLFFGKFQENLDELRRRRGQVAGAEINTMGVLGTAFALGLNNMHRRAVRTGLTCATLVLITFAMICFTSVRDDVVNSATAIGRAPYQGLLVRGRDFQPIQESELFAFNTRYGADFKVAARRMLVGVQTWDQNRYNPQIEAVYEPTNGPARRAEVASIMQFSPHEPLRDRIASVAGEAWFQEQTPGSEEPAPVLVPEALLAALGLTAADVAEGPVTVRLNGTPVRITGVFEAAALRALRDLDGRDLLPFDISAMRTVRLEGDSVLAAEDDPRLDADAIVLARTDSNFPGVGYAKNRLVSVAVDLGPLGYRAARDVVDRYLEQSGQPAYYGIDEVAYLGRRARERSLAGLLDLLIPMIIAAMTVLNTMRGSVYERRDEIFVYNAVGIAPRYIFAMFFSEAFVYSVVGSVLGFILSQGTGQILTAIGFTGGLKMTFTSLNTIYASLAIMAAVFISTLFPALSAMEIAAPAEDSGWRVPDPVGDRIRMVLPFTFDKRDRVAVVEFFRRFFEDHGEGSSGPFFAGPPAVRVAPSESGPIPEVDVTVWLRPFDLGVSQRIRIDLPPDPETGEYLAWATLERLSGSRESWVRLNHPFVGRLRRQFLHWRAVQPAERQNLFAEARQRLSASVSPTRS